MSEWALPYFVGIFAGITMSYLSFRSGRTDPAGWISLILGVLLVAAIVAILF